MGRILAEVLGEVLILVQQYERKTTLGATAGRGVAGAFHMRSLHACVCFDEYDSGVTEFRARRAPLVLLECALHDMFDSALDLFRSVLCAVAYHLNERLVFFLLTEITVLFVFSVFAEGHEELATEPLAYTALLRA